MKLELRQRESILSLVSGLCFAVTVGSASAQEMGRFTAVQAQVLYSGNAALSGSDPSGRLDVENLIFSARAGYPLRIGPTTSLIIEGRYELTSNVWNSEGSPLLRDVYHAPMLRVALQHDLGEGWGFLASAGGGVASDMDGFGANDLRYSTSAGVAFSVSPGLRIAGGIAYTNLMKFLAPVLPFFDVVYQIDGAELRLGFPRGMSLWVTVTDRIDVGLLVDLLSQRYGIHAMNRIADEYSAFNTTIGPAGRVALWRGWYIQGCSGYDVRQVRLHAQGAVTYESSSLGNWFVTLSVGYLPAVSDGQSPLNVRR